MRFPALIAGLLWLLALPAWAAPNIHGQEVTYTIGDQKFVGYVAYDHNVDGKRPGVIVVHEWWGHNEHARESARRLALAGYTAFAVDMYGDGKLAEHPKDAGAFAGEVRQNFAAGRERFAKAMELLKDHHTVDPTRIGAIGYCFGGGVVLNMARAGEDLKAVASFHGAPTAAVEAKPGDVKARMLVLHGALDPMVKPEHLAAFQQEMNDLGADYRVIVYSGATHSFTNPQADDFAKRFNMPIGYNSEVDLASWRDMLQYFSESFNR